METLFEPPVILYLDENKISYFGHIAYNPSKVLLDMISKQLTEQEVVTIYKEDDYGWLIRKPWRMPIAPDPLIINRINNDTIDTTTT